MTEGLSWPGRWPITVKVPAVVALFMAAISAVLTNAVLDRLARAQQGHFENLAAVYLDALSSTVLLYVLRDDTWEVFDALDRAKSVGSFGNVDVIVANDRDQIVASTDPRNLPAAAPVPASWVRGFETGRDVSVRAEGHEAEARRILAYQGRAIGVIYARFDISTLLEERREVFRTLIITNAALTLAMMAAAYFAVRRMVAPMRVLSSHINRSVFGPVEPVSETVVLQLNGEYRRLFSRFNAMARAVNEREMLAQQLAGEERLASLGRLASGLAHEINNPLGGLFNSLDTLRRHGDRSAVRDRTLGILERGLSHIRDVVRAALATYKVEKEPRRLERGDLEDLRLLIEPEMTRRAVSLRWENRVEEDLPLPAGPIRQAVLNLLLNAVEASALGGSIRLSAQPSPEALVIEVEDAGAGLDESNRSYLEGRSETRGREAGTGLGLWIVRRLSDELGARISVRSPASGHGTVLSIRFPLWPTWPGMPPAGPVPKETSHAG